MHKLRIGTNSLKLIICYLSDIYQFVQVDGKPSDCLQVYHRAPQGSILRPVLFNIYISYIKEDASGISLQYVDYTSTVPGE